MVDVAEYAEQILIAGGNPHTLAPVSTLSIMGITQLIFNPLFTLNILLKSRQDEEIPQ